MPCRATVLSAPLTTARQIHDLPSSQAVRAIPIHLTAVVTYYQPEEENLFVADATGGVFVWGEQRTDLRAGDLIEIRGVTRKSLRTVVSVTEPIRIVSRNNPVIPRLADYRAFLSGAVDCHVITLRGVVRSASLERHGADMVAQLQLLMPGGLVQAYIQNFAGLDLTSLVDADIDLTGVAGAAFNAVGEIMRPRLLANSARDLRVLSRPPLGPWQSGLVDIKDVEQDRYVVDRSRHVHVQGAVTAYDPGYSMVIQNGDSSLFVTTRQIDRVELGSVVDVIGFPDDHAYAAVLEDAQFRLLGRRETINPKPVTYADAITGAHSDEFVTLRGTVSSELHGELSDTMVIIVDQHAVELVLRREGRRPLPDLPAGTVVTAQGICRVTPSIEWKHPLLFRLDLRDGNDLTVINLPSWWTVEHLMMMVGTLALLVSGVLFWVALLQRKVRTQTEQLRRSMQLERERSRVLEQINSDTELTYLLMEICSSMNSLVEDASCTIRLQTPSDMLNEATGRNVEERHVYSRDLLDATGKRMASFCAYLPVSSLSWEYARTTFASGANLAILAINQRQLIADLNHSSMHDQLTGLPNRRLCDTHLATTLRNAASTDKRILVAYIDIDRFKQVNDRFGHKIGDLYLRTLAERFGCKGKAGDFLARIGGDEFLLIASDLESTGEAEQYGRWLDSCFDRPFRLDGVELTGSASVGIAIFPDHGRTEEELKCYADLQMYEAKRRVAQVRKRARSQELTMG